MAKKLYVGNLPYGMTDSDLQNLFAPHGAVQSAQVIKDRDTGRSKGFGFVEMDTGTEAQAAIDTLNGQEVNGRALTVNEARPREDRAGNQRGFAGSRRQGGFGGDRRYQAVRANRTPSQALLGGGCPFFNREGTHGGPAQGAKTGWGRKSVKLLSAFIAGINHRHSDGVPLGFPGSKHDGCEVTKSPFLALQIW